MQRLPQESWTHTILRDRPIEGLADLPEAPAGPQKFGPWSPQDFLLARLINAQEYGNYLAAVGLRPATQPKLPTPVAVPGMDRPVRKQSDAQVAYLRNLRATG